MKNKVITIIFACFLTATLFLTFSNCPNNPDSSTTTINSDITTTTINPDITTTTEDQTTSSTTTTIDPARPSSIVKLIFIHHSCGSNWLSTDNGNL